MIRKGFDNKGNKFYYYDGGKRKFQLPVGRPLTGNKIPNGVFGRFIKPAPKAI